jgi:hypothetical protein
MNRDFAANPGSKTLGDRLFEARIEETRALGPTEILDEQGAQAVLDAVATPAGLRLSDTTSRVKDAKDRARSIAATWQRTVDGRATVFELGFWWQREVTGHAIVAYGTLSSETLVWTGRRTIAYQNRTVIIEPVQDDAVAALRAVGHALQR